MANAGPKLRAGFMLAPVSGPPIKASRKTAMLIIAGFLVVRMLIIRIKVMTPSMKKALYSDTPIWTRVTPASREWPKTAFRHSAAAPAPHN